MTENNIEKIMVINLGGTREMALGTAAFAAIREFHPNAHIILLTTARYAEFGQQSGYFNEIWVDPLLNWYDVPQVLHFLKKLRNSGIQLVYDLQNVRRSNMYFRCMGRNKPLWNSSNINWCSHYYDNPDAHLMHFLDRQAEQLMVTGMEFIPPPDISWLQADISKFSFLETGQPYALLVAGGLEDEKQSRWPESGYVEVAEWLAEIGVLPVFIGDEADKALIKSIDRSCVHIDIANLAGRTSLADIAELARGAVFAIGAGDGYMHLMALTGCPSIFLYSGYFVQEIHTPIGDAINIMYQREPSQILPSTVIDRLIEMFGLNEGEEAQDNEDEEAENDSA